MEATPKQAAFLSKLWSEREHSLTQADLDRALGHKPSASGLITALLAAPKKAQGDSEGPQEPGMYRMGDRIFKVQKSRSSDRLYAKELVDINGRRLTELDEVVNFEFVYAPGAMRELRQEHRMTLDEAKSFGIQFGVCCVCGAHLKDATSVAEGIGPVCGKRV